jgi:hypothetical protein
VKTVDDTPTDDTLLAYDQGLLSEAEIDAITRWLESHPEAEERIRTLTEKRPNALPMPVKQCARGRSACITLTRLAWFTATSSRATFSSRAVEL